MRYCVVPQRLDALYVTHFDELNRTVQTEILASNAHRDFKADVLSFFAGGQPERVRLDSYVPRVKVQRVLQQLLWAEPALEIERVAIRAVSGCSDLVGSVSVEASTGSQVFDFAWCCRWRAESEGYVDTFGFPDQMRAAQEFGWRCFRRWERRGDD